MNFAFKSDLRFCCLGALLIVCVLGNATAQPSNEVRNIDSVKVPSNTASSDFDTADEGLQTIAADTSRSIVKQFKADNPDAREHKLEVVSEAFTEDKSNPALKLERLWVGGKGTLLEIAGLPRQGQPNSAAIAPETLRLTNLKTGQAASLLAFEGVAQVLDEAAARRKSARALPTM